MSKKTTAYKKIVTLADMLLELNRDDLLALVSELHTNGSDSDHGLDGDQLAWEIAEAACNVRMIDRPST